MRWVVALWLVWVGCEQSAAPTPHASSPAASTAVATPRGLQRAAQLHYRVELTGGAQADETLPMVIALHGLGDRPENFVGVFRGFDTKARVVAPRGLSEHGQGFSWFPISVRKRDPERVAPGVRRAADAIAEAVSELVGRHPTAGKPIVCGFSQGGMLSFTLAVHHGERFALAIPLAGWLPPPLIPESIGTVPRIFALHGSEDSVLPLEATQLSVSHLKRLGVDVELREYAGVGHSLSPAMRAAFHAAIERQIAAPVR